MLFTLHVPSLVSSFQAGLRSNVDGLLPFAVSKARNFTGMPVCAIIGHPVATQLCSWGYEIYDVPCEDCPGMFESVVRVRLSERYCPICWPLSTSAPAPVPAFQEENEAHPGTFGPCLPIQVEVDIGYGAGADTVEHVDHILDDFFDEFYEEQEMDEEDDQGRNIEQSIRKAKEEENNEESTVNTQQEEAGGMGLSHAEEAEERELPTELEEDEMLDFEPVKPRNRRQRRRQGHNFRSELPNRADEPKLEAR